MVFDGLNMHSSELTLSRYCDDVEVIFYIKSNCIEYMSSYMRKCIAEYPHKFFFVHSTIFSENANVMPEIFESGYIHPASKFDKNATLGREKEVFMMIYFVELKNMNLGIGDIIIRPEIICDYPILYNNEWDYGEISESFDPNSILLSLFFNIGSEKEAYRDKIMESIQNKDFSRFRIGDFTYKQDTKKQLYDKLDRIYKETMKYAGGAGQYSHEFVVSRSISIRKYIFGVLLEKNIDSTEKTKEIIKRKRYKLLIKEIEYDNKSSKELSRIKSKIVASKNKKTKK